MEVETNPNPSPSFLQTTVKVVLYCCCPFAIYGIYQILWFILENPVIFFSLGAIALVVGLLVESVIEHDQHHPPLQPPPAILTVTHAGDHGNQLGNENGNEVTHGGAESTLLVQRPPNQPKRNYIYVSASDRNSTMLQSSNTAPERELDAEQVMGPLPITGDNTNVTQEETGIPSKRFM